MFEYRLPGDIEHGDRKISIGKFIKTVMNINFNIGEIFVSSS